MTPPSPALGIDEIYRAELERVVRYATDTRAASSWKAIIPLLLVGLVDPRPVRLSLLALGYVILVWLSQREQTRLAKDGFSRGFMARNGLAMAALHALLFLVTGALGSPFLPLMLVLTLMISVALGRDATTSVYLRFQLGVVALLTTVQAAGLAAIFAPAWWVNEPSVAHTLTRGAVFAGLVFGAHRLGCRLRQLFDGIVARVAAGRADLLSAHQAQAEELTALSGAIAHELKNPLASVKGLAGLLARDIPDGKPAERLGVLRGEVDRMQGILEEFLNFSRPVVPVAASVVDVVPLCTEVAALHEGIARDRGVRVSVSGVGIARLDLRKTRQVLINLVQNALDASSPGSALGLTVSVAEDRLTVCVDDEGSGPDPELGDRVFDPGVTTKPRGNGLGLTIARALARQQGGDLTLAPRSPHGCRATLTLPTGGVS